MNGEARAAHPGAFAMLLRRFRTDAGLTQEELAEKAELSPKAVSSLERGARRRPHRVTVALLADALELDDETRLELERAARSDVPGQAVPVPAKKVDLPAGAFLGAAPGGRMVARSGEISALAAAIEAAGAGEGRTVLLGGEPGIGKTRLAQEAHVLLRARGFQTAVGRCYQPRASVPYFPLLEAIGALFESAPESLRSDAARRWPSLAALLLDRPEFSGQATDAGHDQILVFRAAAAFIVALTDVAPVAILVDDLQWADASSVQLLHHLARETRARGVFLLATYRDTDVPGQPVLADAIRDLGREGVLLQLDVARLDLSATRELITDIVGEWELSDELGEFIFRRAEGNPYFVRQLVGALGPNSDDWSNAPLPDTIRSLVTQRVGGLPESAQGMLTQISVLGQAFSFDDALALTDQDERELESALEGARARGLVRATGNDGYSFDHGLTQQTLYDLLPSRSRKRLHGKFGAAVASLAERDRRGRVAELAWHFLQAEDREQALHWSLAAGGSAVGVSAMSEAEYHFATAQRVAVELEDRDGQARSLEGLGRTFNILGRYEPAGESLEAADRLYREAEDDAGRGRVAAELGGVYRMVGRTDDGITVIESALERLTNADGTLTPDSPVADLWAGLAQLLWPAGRRDEALRATQRAAEIAGASGNQRVKGWAETQEALILERLGRRQEALTVAEAALKAVEPGELGLLLYCLSVLTQMYQIRGDWDRAREMIERSIEGAGHRGDPLYQAAALARRGGYLIWSGRWAEAAEALDAAAGYVEADDPINGFITFTRAQMLVWQGDAESLERARIEVEAVVESQRNVDRLVAAVCFLAEIDGVQGDHERALARLNSLRDKQGFRDDDPTFGICLATTYLGLGRLDEAGATCARFLESAQADGLRTPLVDLTRLAAEITLAGKSVATCKDGPAGAPPPQSTSVAHRHADESLRLAREQGSPYKEGLALQTLAAAARRSRDGETSDTDATAQEHLSAAIAIFDRLGATGASERAKRPISV